jgi:hypothetical protein
MTKDILGRWQCEVELTSPGTSNWHFPKTENTILQLTVSSGGSGYVEVTNDNIERINSGNITTFPWAYGVVSTNSIDQMISTTAFRLVCVTGACRLSASGRGVER